MESYKVVEYGDTIKFSYTGKVTDDYIFDRSEGPLSVEIGTGGTINGLENALLGMQEGQEKDVEIPPEDGYGPEDPNLVVRIPNTLFDQQDFEPRVGMYIETSRGDCIVSKLLSDSVLLDFNHPLAGKTLFFMIRVDKIIKGK